MPDTSKEMDDPDKKGCPGPPGWGLGVRLTSPRKKIYLLRCPSHVPSNRKTSPFSQKALGNEHPFCVPQNGVCMETF